MPRRGNLFYIKTEEKSPLKNKGQGVLRSFQDNGVQWNSDGLGKQSLSLAKHSLDVGIP